MATFSSAVLCKAHFSGICPAFQGVAPSSTSCQSSGSGASLAEYCNGLVGARDVLGRPALLRSTFVLSPSTFFLALPERAVCRRRSVRVNAVRPDLSDSLNQPEHTGTAAYVAAKLLSSGASRSDSGSGNSEAPLKKCTVCDRSKFPADFEKTMTTADQRSEACRACLAAHRAVRMGRPLHHLSLSVDAAWDKGKACLRCGHFKEIRDFARKVREADGLAIYCRACFSELNSRPLVFSPVDVPQRCGSCGQLKAASEFHAHRGRPTGLASSCKLCSKKCGAEYQAKLRASASFPREEKFCSSCGETKKVAEFPRTPVTLDGFESVCIDCFRARRNAASRARRNAARRRRPEGPVN